MTAEATNCGKEERRALRLAARRQEAKQATGRKTDPTKRVRWRETPENKAKLTVMMGMGWREPP